MKTFTFENHLGETFTAKAEKGLDVMEDANKAILWSNWKDGMYAYRSVLTRHKVSAKCTLCGTKDKRVLAVHHVDENRKNNKVENLRWLCHNCHHLVHYY